LSVSDEVLRKLLPLKGKVIEGKVVGKAGELPLLEVDDLLFPAESRVSLKFGSRVSLWVKGISGGKLYLQLLSQDDIDDDFFKLGLRDRPETRLAYKLLKYMGVQAAKEIVELLSQLLIKAKDPTFVAELLKALHLRFGLSSPIISFLLHLGGDLSNLKDLLLRILFYGSEEIKGMLKEIIPRKGKGLASEIRGFLLRSGVLKFGGLSEALLLRGKSKDELSLLGWLLLPRLLSFAPKEGDWLIYFWFPVLDDKGELSVFLLKRHKVKQKEQDGERYELLLDLKTLGKIKVLFYLLKGKLWITFEAESEGTLASLRRKSSELFSILESQGYSVGGVSVRAMVVDKGPEGEELDIRV